MVIGFGWRSRGEGNGGTLKESREGGEGQRCGGCRVLVLVLEGGIVGAWGGGAERKNC